MKPWHIYSELVFKSHREVEIHHCVCIAAAVCLLPPKTVLMCLCVCPPSRRQTTRSRDRSASCRVGGRCKTRPGHMIPSQGKRMKERGCHAKPQPLKQPLTGTRARLISPGPRPGRAAAVIRMNRAIWMRPPSCVIPELSAAHRLMSSQNEAARTQLRPPPPSGALPPPHEAPPHQGGC